MERSLFMNTMYLGRYGLGVVVTCALISASLAALAQQKFPINTTSEGVQSRYVQQHVIDVGDVAGHQVRILEVHRVLPKEHFALNGIDVVEEWDRGFSDYISGVGPARGYGIWVLEEWKQSVPGMARNGVFGDHGKRIEARHLCRDNENCRGYRGVLEDPRCGVERGRV